MSAPKIVEAKPHPLVDAAFFDYDWKGVIPVNPKTKIPHIKAWQKHETATYPELQEWWTQWPEAVLGMIAGKATGLIFVDVDYPAGGDKTIADLEAKHGPLPPTARFKTPSGHRLIFKWMPGCWVRTVRGAYGIGPGVDVRGHYADGGASGQSVMPPSVRPDGGRYEWEPGHSLSKVLEAPPWLQFQLAFSAKERLTFDALGIRGPESFDGRPAAEWQAIALEKIRSHRGPLKLRTPTTPGEPPILTLPDRPLDEAQKQRIASYIRGAGEKICAEIRDARYPNQEDTLNRGGLRLNALLKGASYLACDVTQLEAELFDNYCAACIAVVCEEAGNPWLPDHAIGKWQHTAAGADPAELLSKFEAGADVFDIVEDATAGEVSDASVPVRYVAWPDADKTGKPAPNSVTNAVALFQHLGVELRVNTFTGVKEYRTADSPWAEVTDLAINKVWIAAAHHKWGVAPDRLMRMIDVLADRTHHHPVHCYLESLKWDQVPRLDTWLSQYLGTDDTPLIRAFGRATLIGAVRRVLEPGAKHDTMLVLEGPQGNQKSSAIQVLGGAWYGEGVKLGIGAKELIELTTGHWIIEIAELSGMANKEIESIKDQLSRQTDKARAAYARMPATVKRQFIFIGTSNQDQYLRDTTGNRRFLPVKCTTVDLDALRRDRDQLWAEAHCKWTYGFESNEIPRELWSTAAEVQEARRVVTPIEDYVTQLLRDKAGIVAKDDIWLAARARGIPGYTVEGAKAMTKAAKKLGWEPGQNRRDGELIETYRKPVRGAQMEWLTFYDGKFIPKSQHPFPANIGKPSTPDTPDDA